MSNEGNENNGTNNEEPKLYAGKFKTVEELENGYKSSLPTFQENEALKKRLDDATKVPDAYLKPEGLELDEARLTNLQARAKEAGMTQAQYEKFVKSEKAALDARQANFEQAKKDVGEANINVITDYVKKNYPEALHESMINTFIGNKTMRDAAMSHRERLMANNVPGFGNSTPVKHVVTDDDVRKAMAAKDKNPADRRARDHYMALLAARAEQQKAS